MTAYKPIDCTAHDYLEIICMDRCEVEIIIDEGGFTGKALTTESNGSGEFLVVERSDGTCDSIRMDKIGRIRILSDPRRFDEVTIKG